MWVWSPAALRLATLPSSYSSATLGPGPIGRGWLVVGALWWLWERYCQRCLSSWPTSMNISLESHDLWDRERIFAPILVEQGSRILVTSVGIEPIPTGCTCCWSELKCFWGLERHPYSLWECLTSMIMSDEKTLPFILVREIYTSCLCYVHPLSPISEAKVPWHHRYCRWQT